MAKIQSISYSALLRLAISLIILYQLIELGQVAHRLITTKVGPNRQLNAISRSADTAYGHEFLENISVLRTEIPGDATIVVTGTTGLPQYDARDFMQYFLFPRNTVGLACPGDQVLEECLNSELLSHDFLLVGNMLLGKMDRSIQERSIQLNSGVILIRPPDDG